MNQSTIEKLKSAVLFRRNFFAEGTVHDAPFRLVNGFTEGLPGLVIDVFAKTAVIHDYGTDPYDPTEISNVLLEELPFLKAVILKNRAAHSYAEKNGVLLHGVKPDDRIKENGVTYALDLMMNRDNSFYADTRFLRQYLLTHVKDMDVLNTFAYTGSLGVAAAAGGAASVLQTDLSDKFMQTAKRSLSMNRIYFTNKNFLAGNFFPVIGKLKRENRKFHCIILDPPFFSKTPRGEVDLCAAPEVPINKVRPLIHDNGLLITVNNSLYLSGEEFLQRLNVLCKDGYLSIEETIPIPPDFIGPDPDYMRHYAVSPAPFNHPTKIVVLRVKTKSKAIS